MGVKGSKTTSTQNIMQTLTIEVLAENAQKLRDYAHKAASTAGRVAAADRLKGDLVTQVTGKATTDRFGAANKRTVVELEHLAFLKALGVIEKLAKVNLSHCLAPVIAAAGESEMPASESSEAPESEAPTVPAEAPASEAPATETETASPRRNRRSA